MIKPNLDIETISTCNRACPGCMRNSHPNRVATRQRFSNHQLAEKYIYDAINQAEELGFFNEICLSYYNEPLLDWRLPHIIQTIKKHYTMYPLYLHSNGDMIERELAEQLDGILDKIIFTLYMGEPKKSERAALLKYFFTETEVVTITQVQHVPTHFSPLYDVTTMAKQHQSRTCLEPQMHVIIAHDGKYRMCCNDLLGEFNLGAFSEKSIKQHWEEKQLYIQTLSQTNGRKSYSYCKSCPRS